MRKIKYQRYLWIAAAVFWMASIFYFSNQKAVQSSEISGSLTYRMAEEVNHIFKLAWEKKTVLKYAALLEHPVRKAAHMTEYAILAWILLGNCMQYQVLKRKCWLWAFLGTALYAATDEFHQLFIEGRSGEVKDVCIDSLGGFLGLLLAWFAVRLWKKRRKDDRL